METADTLSVSLGAAKAEVKAEAQDSTAQGRPTPAAHNAARDKEGWTLLRSAAGPDDQPVAAAAGNTIDNAKPAGAEAEALHALALASFCGASSTAAGGGLKRTADLEISNSGEKRVRDSDYQNLSHLVPKQDSTQPNFVNGGQTSICMTMPATLSSAPSQFALSPRGRTQAVAVRKRTGQGRWPERDQTTAPGPDPFRGMRAAVLLPKLRCNSGGKNGKGCCAVFYGTETMAAGVLPPNFLPYQRNYSFSCSKCSANGTPRCELTKSMKFEAIVDAFLNLMWETQRKEFKVAEIKSYLLKHWDTLLFGWEKKPPEKFDIAPYFKKKAEFVQLRKTFWQLSEASHIVAITTM